MFLDGLAFKVWRMREGEWFEGTYVFDSEQERLHFREEFEPGAATSPGSRSSARPRCLIEEWEVVAIAEGPAGFRRGGGAVGQLSRRRSPAQRRTATSTPSLTGSSAVTRSSWSRSGLAEVAQRDRRLVAGRRVGDPVVPQHVVDDEHPAGPQQPHRVLDVGGVGVLVGVDVDHVVAAVGHPGQDLGRRPGDDPGALVG